MDFLRQWTGRRVLVTGGTGFIGQHILALGVAAGADLYNLSLDSDAPSDVQHYHVGLTDRGQIQAIIRDVNPEAILHLAAGGVAYGSAELTGLLNVNTLGLQILLETADALVSKPCVVIAGSGFEYAVRDLPLAETAPIAPFSAYGVSKAAASIVAGYYAQRMPITLLRLFSIYGPGEKPPRLVPYIIEQVREGQPVELTGGEQVRDYTYVEDVAEAFWRALTLPAPSGKPRLINIASGQAITLRTFVETLKSVLEKKGYTPDLRFGAKPYRPDEPMVYLADVSRMKQLLKWVPQTTLEEGLRRTVEAILEQN